MSRAIVAQEVKIIGYYLYHPLAGWWPPVVLIFNCLLPSLFLGYFYLTVLAVDSGNVDCKMTIAKNKWTFSCCFVLIWRKFCFVIGPAFCFCKANSLCFLFTWIRLIHLLCCHYLIIIIFVSVHPNVHSKKPCACAVFLFYLLYVCCISTSSCVLVSFVYLLMFMGIKLMLSSVPFHLWMRKLLLTWSLCGFDRFKYCNRRKLYEIALYVIIIKYM